MSKIESNYTSSYYAEAVAQKSKKADEVKNAKAAKTAAAEKSGKSGDVQLSDAAQKLLEKLRKKHGNMDFMVTSASNAADARSMLAGSTKEYSVLFSAEELEKMASDEEYEAQYMAQVQGAIQMTNKIAQQGGFGPASGKGDLTSVGVSIDSDGTKTFFAELEKASEQQKERIEAAREKKAEEKKASAKNDNSTKKVTIQASYQMELIDKLNAFDWKK